MFKELLNLLNKYREALLLFYVSLKQNQFDAAISYIPYIEDLEQKLQSLLSSQATIQENKDKDLTKLIKKILLIQKKIEILYYHKQNNLNKEINNHFHTKIDFLIKKFLQEKGL